jgi:carbamoyl-phosphate synthase large subunit
MSAARPVLVDQFLEDAYEYDVDAVSDGKNVYIGGIMQHIEAAGVHSGDSACVFPPFEANPEVEKEMIDATVKIARDIGVQGFLNIQFAVKDNVLYILEVNPRASRTVPFLAKASGVNLIDAVVRSWMGEDLASQGLVGEDGVGVGHCTAGWAVKEAVFSFDRFADLDPLLGPEMKSTGEGIGIGDTFGEAYSKAQFSVSSSLPTAGGVFVSVHDSDKEKTLPVVKELVSMGFTLSATRGTAEFLQKHGIESEVILKVQDGHPNVIDHLRSGKVDLLINTPKGRFSQSDDAQIRVEAVRHKVPYTTTTAAAKAALAGIKYLKTGEYQVRPIEAGKGFGGLYKE